MNTTSEYHHVHDNIHKNFQNTAKNQNCEDQILINQPESLIEYCLSTSVFVHEDDWALSEICHTDKAFDCTNKNKSFWESLEASQMFIAGKPDNFDHAKQPFC